MLVIINYGMGNLGSIFNMFCKIGVESRISSKPDDILKAERLILPGVGAFSHGMSKLKTLNLLPALHQKVIVEKTPILGICLGLQLFANHSEEGDAAGLGWIDASVIRFRFQESPKKLRIPHMGWNCLKDVKTEKLFWGMNEDHRFYFVHSYHFVAQNPDVVAAKSNYGIDFTAAVVQDSILGVQFHPEKSLKFGMKLLQNFMEFY